MNPVVALVGRPNVGKSTLFNCLTRSRGALVADQAGLTRDRKYGVGRLGPCPYIVVDTGGISDLEQALAASMALQTFQAIEEADLVLFLVDASAGLTQADRAIAERLRRAHKSIWVVVNKVDGHQPESVLAEFHELGLGEPLPVAAAHNRGVAALIEHVLAPFTQAAAPIVELAAQSYDVCDKMPAHDQKIEAKAAKAGDAHGMSENSAHNPEANSSKDQDIKVAVIGRPNVGKSTLINRLLGEERVLVFDQAGTTTDSIDIHYERAGQKYTLIDTAGVRRRKNVSETIEKFSIIKTLQAIENSHLCVCVLDARTGLVEQDLRVLSFILDAGRSLVIAVNKWDGMGAEEKDQVRKELERRLHFADFADLHFISAKHGTNVGHLYPSLLKAYRSSVTRHTTNLLTRILEDAVSDHQPPLVNGRRIKLRYAHQGGSQPPIVVIHGNQTDRLPDTYKRYLTNCFRRVLEIAGTPIRLVFKTGENPYAGRVVKSKAKSGLKAVSGYQRVKKIRSVKKIKVVEKTHGIRGGKKKVAASKARTCTVH